MRLSHETIRTITGRMQRMDKATTRGFVGVTGAGSRPFCLSSIDSLLRRSGGSGSLIPAEGCPVWSGE